jgi:LPXTG-site transpeptidase (sortase) family protein
MNKGTVLRIVGLSVIFAAMVFTIAGIVWVDRQYTVITTPPLAVGPTSISQTATTSTAPVRVNYTTPSTEIYTHPIDNPVRIVIPSIDVDVPIVHVGLKEEGIIETPTFGNAAWFRLGPSPGESGPSVIIGHVSGKKGKDVFYRLGELTTGSVFSVYNENGDKAVFVVDSAETLLKTELPTEKIWPSTYMPLLTLITCGGEYDKETRHYLSNTIVYCHLLK